MLEILKLILGTGLLLTFCLIQIGCPPVQPSVKNAGEPVPDAAHLNETIQNDPVISSIVKLIKKF